MYTKTKTTKIYALSIIVKKKITKKYFSVYINLVSYVKLVKKSFNTFVFS